MQPSALLLAVCWVQGMYFLLTGVLPLISIRTFEAITGPKTDKWLVQTVGVLVTVIGAVLLLAAHAQRFSFEIGLLDAAAEVLLALGWIVGGLWSR
jgi:hypothetical protein